MGIQNKILVQLYHPLLHKSRVNRELLKAIEDLEGVTIRLMYDLYPDFHINVKEEQSYSWRTMISLSGSIHSTGIPPLPAQRMDRCGPGAWICIRTGRKSPGREEGDDSHLLRRKKGSLQGGWVAKIFHQAVAGAV